MRILVVDDNDDVRESLALVLNGAGHETRLARHGGEALAIQQRHPSDVLITDIFMPDTDGLETIARFRSGWPDLMIVAISGGGHFVTRDYLESATDMGADALMRKPLDPAELLRILKRFSQHARKSR